MPAPHPVELAAAGVLDGVRYPSRVPRIRASPEQVNPTGPKLLSKSAWRGHATSNASHAIRPVASVFAKPREELFSVFRHGALFNEPPPAMSLIEIALDSWVSRESNHRPVEREGRSAQNHGLPRLGQHGCKDSTQVMSDPNICIPDRGRDLFRTRTEVPVRWSPLRPQSGHWRNNPLAMNRRRDPLPDSRGSGQPVECCDPQEVTCSRAASSRWSSEASSTSSSR